MDMYTKRKLLCDYRWWSKYPKKHPRYQNEKHSFFLSLNRKERQLNKKFWSKYWSIKFELFFDDNMECIKRENIERLTNPSIFEATYLLKVIKLHNLKFDKDVKKLRKKIFNSKIYRKKSKAERNYDNIDRCYDSGVYSSSATTKCDSTYDEKPEKMSATNEPIIMSDADEDIHVANLVKLYSEIVEMGTFLNSNKKLAENDEFNIAPPTIEELAANHAIFERSSVSPTIMSVAPQDRVTSSCPQNNKDSITVESHEPKPESLVVNHCNNKDLLVLECIAPKADLFEGNDSPATSIDEFIDLTEEIDSKEPTEINLNQTKLSDQLETTEIIEEFTRQPNTLVDATGSNCEREPNDTEPMEITDRYETAVPYEEWHKNNLVHATEWNGESEENNYESQPIELDDNFSYETSSFVESDIDEVYLSNETPKLDDRELRILIDNFDELQSDMQNSLLEQLKKIEESEPERAKQLWAFYNCGAVRETIGAQSTDSNTGNFVKYYAEPLNINLRDVRMTSVEVRNLIATINSLPPSCNFNV